MTTKWGSGARPGGYYQISASPGASLIFVVPLVIFYEVGTVLFASDPTRHVETRIVAYSKLREALATLHATAAWLPAGVVLSILAAQWALSKEVNRPRLSTMVGMLAESVVLAVPILGMAAVVRAYLLAGSGVGEGVVLSVGAGVYEELVFRLVGVTALHAVSADLLRLRGVIATTISVTVMAMVFSLYHYWGAENFTPQSFVFRGLAGVYFGVIFVNRGFGITVGSHACYDILALGLLGRLSVAT